MQDKYHGALKIYYNINVKKNDKINIFGCYVYYIWFDVFLSSNKNYVTHDLSRFTTRFYFRQTLDEIFLEMLLLILITI